MFKNFTFIFLLIIFHELGHALVGKLLGFELDKIIIYPYGGLTKFKMRENHSLLKEIIMLLSGPIFQTITYFILIYFFSYEYIKVYHLTILIFNLLPILTLDGGRLLELLLSYFFSYLKSFYITIFISFFTIFILLIFCFFFYYNLNLYLMNLFLIFKLIKSIKDIKYCYQRFLLERHLYDFSFKKKKVGKNIYDFYHECYHFIDFQDEKNYLKKYFKS